MCGPWPRMPQPNQLCRQYRRGNRHCPLGRRDRRESAKRRV